jgi:ribosome-associated toxin RatA of RatAB toxin-antitoxin module
MAIDSACDVSLFLGVLALAWIALPLDLHARDGGAETFTAEETSRLAEGKLVTRPLRVRRGGVELIGGSSWQVIEAEPEIVWRALHDASRYPKMLPGVKEARVVAEGPDVRTVHVRQGAWPISTSYHVLLRSDPAMRELAFELDQKHAHKLNAGWGFARVVPYRGAKTLIAFGVLADVGRGLLAAVGRSVLQRWMLKVPSTVKSFLERGGRDLYR